MPSVFGEEYSKLNNEQKQAVDAIDGPLLVVAGPGTGKTQLLSMRVANILKKSDAAPNNILCLTFTDAAARNMRERLISLIGQSAYSVAIHTFHSFGVEVANRYPEFFYDAAAFEPIDELGQHELLEPIFDRLGHSNPLSVRHSDDYIWLYPVRQAISQLKRGGLTPEQFRAILDHNAAFIDYAEPILRDAFANKINKGGLGAFSRALKKLETFRQTPPATKSFRSLKDVCCESLTAALDDGETKSLSAWKMQWLSGTMGDHKLKARWEAKKLKALAGIYEKYQRALYDNMRYDYDDMVLSLIGALNKYENLKSELQEQFLYVLVDEFQDTNEAQLAILRAWADNPAHEGKPNIMAVGDDDQAIFKFQGAEVSNMMAFQRFWDSTVVVTLKDNYRSTQKLLDSARFVITQGANRLETVLDIDKRLTGRLKGKTVVERVQLPDTNSEYHYVARAIKMLVEKGENPDEIAVVGRRHEQLIELMPHLAAANVPVTYDRRENVLDEPHVHEIVQLSRAVVAAEKQNLAALNTLLPEIVSFSFWRIRTRDIWELSYRAAMYGEHWLELMLKSTKREIRFVAEFLLEMARRSPTETVELMLDLIIGNTTYVPDERGDYAAKERRLPDTQPYVSPYKSYYFSAGSFITKRAEYIELLSGLASIRRRLRVWKPEAKLKLEDFVAFIDLHERTRTRIVDASPHREAAKAVHVMTGHAAKGLEFRTVFIIGACNEIWNQGQNYGGLKFPPNLPITPAGEDEDDRLRLFFVAMTRAKNNLYISSHKELGTGKDATPLKFLEAVNEQQPAEFVTRELVVNDLEALEERLSADWSIRHIRAVKRDGRAALLPQLERYRLSATHLNTFTDVTIDGPQTFLLSNFLRFPGAKHPSASFGNAVHIALKRAHERFVHDKKTPSVDDLLRDFELSLKRERLADHDFERELNRGRRVLPIYYQKRRGSFSAKDRVELSFDGQNVVLDSARLTGTVDRIVETDKTHLKVIDIKTGKPVKAWGRGTAYERIKQHKFRQQLAFYRLLVERARDFSGKYAVEQGAIDFVEPLNEEELVTLPLELNNKEVERVASLIKAVWYKIMRLDFPSVDSYPQTVDGIEQFEQDLIEEFEASQAEQKPVGETAQQSLL